eukprot:6194660-Pleurochrysis_carterae.AAC.6
MLASALAATFAPSHRTRLPLCAVLSDVKPRPIASRTVFRVSSPAPFVPHFSPHPLLTAACAGHGGARRGAALAHGRMSSLHLGASDSHHIAQQIAQHIARPMHIASPPARTMVSISCHGNPE